MQAIVYHGTRDFRIDQVPDPVRQEDTDVVVRVERTAICGSDLHIWHGDPLPATGFAMGHEFLGTIEDVGPAVQQHEKGDRVMVSCIVGCGHCPECRVQLCSGCPHTSVFGPLTNVFGSPILPGGQAEAVRVPFADANCFAIPEGLDDEQVLFLTDILPTGYMGADLAEVGPGDVVVVFGCGPVGTFAQRSAQLRGASCVIAVDLDDGRLAKAEKRGCLPVNPSRQNLLEQVHAVTGGRGANCAIEAVGHEALVRDALEVLRPGGHVSVIGVIVQPGVSLPFLETLMAKNLTLRSGMVNPQRYIPTLLPLIEQGRLDPTEIITHRMALSDGVRGYEIFDAHEEDVLKVVLAP
jgi:threonine dehydrogenase-like Zn-dependent dehydrogenase